MLTDEGKTVYRVFWRSDTLHEKNKTTFGSVLLTTPLTPQELNAALQALQWPKK